MAYFHIDRAQAYVQALGFTNVLNRPIRANVDAPIPGPPTEDGQDNSFFDLLTGELTFGTGCADDAEDAETIVHEYGHAIQEAQVPGFPAGADAGAIGEGFGDYFASALSATFAPTRRLRGLLRRVGRVRVGARRLPAAGGPGAAARRALAGLRRRPTTSTAGARSGPARSGRSGRRSGRHGRRQARDPVALQPHPGGELRPGAHARSWPPTRRCTRASIGRS